MLQPYRIAAIIAISASSAAADTHAENFPAYSDIVYGYVAPTCTVSDSEFAGWSQLSGTDTKSIAPNSAAYAINSDCDFYKWAAQAFLWITETNQSSELVLQGDDFFTVGHVNTSTDPSYSRKLYPHDASTVPLPQLRTVKSGATIPTPQSNEEVGQAGGDAVLMTANGELVFYDLYVNSGLAYFNSYFNSNANPETMIQHFPSSAKEMDAVTKYIGDALPDGYDASQLTIEIKSSWVKASTLPNADDYITKMSVIPVIDTSSALPWHYDESTTETVKMALLGMHVVGTIKDHPEFVWATFEHYQNAPSEPFYLIANDGTKSLQTNSLDKDYLLFNAGSEPAPNYAHCLKFDATDNMIKATSDNQQSYCSSNFANVIRRAPWGNLANDPSEQTITQNTMLVSLNNSIRSQLTTNAVSDVRSNYIQTGNIWSDPIAPSKTAPIPDSAGTYATDLSGGLLAANMTMETCTQGTNCFSCHSVHGVGGSSFASGALSHIFADIEPISLPASQ